MSDLLHLGFTCHLVPPCLAVTIVLLTPMPMPLGVSRSRVTGVANLIMLILDLH